MKKLGTVILWFWGGLIAFGMLSAALSSKGNGTAQTANYDQTIRILQSDNTDLRSQITDMKRQMEHEAAVRFADENRIDILNKYVDAIATDHKSLLHTVNHNAEAANTNAVRDMTQNGACGRQWTQSADGQYFQTNKACTKADLKK